MLIDAHAHLYPAAVMADPAAWATAQGEPWWASCVAPAGRRSRQGWATPSEMVRHLDQAGIDRVVLLGWYWQRQATCAWHNAWMAACQRAYPDRVAVFAAVNPSAGKVALDDLERCLDAGFSGVGELHGGVQGFSHEGDDFAAVVELASRFRVPINLHVTDPVGPHRVAVAPTPLKGFLRMVERHPAVPFIFAHWGGGLPWYEVNPRVRALLQNCFYDTAASPLLYDSTVFERVVAQVGADRVLFGSDYPLLTFPRQSLQPGFRLALGEAQSALRDPATRLAVLGGNAERLLAQRARVSC